MPKTTKKLHRTIFDALDFHEEACMTINWNNKKETRVQYLAKIYKAKEWINKQYNQNEAIRRRHTASARGLDAS